MTEAKKKRKHTLLTSADKLRLAKFYAEGNSYADIKREFGINYKRALRIINKFGLSSRPIGCHERERITDERYKEIADYYMKGNSFLDTAKALGVSCRTVSAALLVVGYDARSKARVEKLTDQAARDVYNRYLQGEPLRGMAAETGIAYTTYSTRFKRLGLPFPVKR